MLAACVYLIEQVVAGQPIGLVVNTLADDERLRMYLFARGMGKWLASNTLN